MTMICKFCKGSLPEGALFCCWCGEKLKKERRSEIKIPEPRLLPSGKWHIYLRAEKTPVTANTPEECRATARAIRMGLTDAAKQPDKITLNEAIEKHLASKSNVLSPSTMRGYRIIQRNRFKPYMNQSIGSVNWQRAVNEEAKTCSAKTLKNAWGFVSGILQSYNIPLLNIHLPQVVPKELPFLQPDQIPVFLTAIKNTRVETAALLALHSLRMSEIMALTWDDIDLNNNLIYVRGAIVPDENNRLVSKEANKNESSRRMVPIFIPRLREVLLMHSGYAPVTLKNQSVYSDINSICAENNLPLIGVHGLRRSFASLAYSLNLNELTTMKIGGWANNSTMRKIYTKLADKDYSSGIEALHSFFDHTP